MIIVVTGTPGCGKTTLAKKLATKTKLTYIDVNRIIRKEKLDQKVDKKRNCKVIDVKKLNRVLIKRIKEARKNHEGLIIDSHMAHHLPPEHVAACIVCTCKLKTLERRLKKRRYSKAKIRENLDCEIFEVCATEARENKHSILTIDCSRRYTIRDVFKRFVKFLLSR